MCVTSGLFEKRARFARFALSLSLSCVVLATGVFPALAQDRPDIVWIQGGHININSAIFSPDGQHFITASSDDFTVKVWRVSDGQLVRTLRGRGPVAISPDGRLLALVDLYSVDSSSRTEVKLVRLSDGQVLRTFRGFPNMASPVRAMAFSPDGQLLAVGTVDGSYIQGETRLWRVSNGQLVRVLRGGSDPVSAVAFSPNGQLLATGNSDGVRLWTVADGQLLNSFIVPHVLINTLAFSPDGQWLVAGSGDRRIRVWRVADWSLQQTLTAHSSHVLAVGFSPDGQYLISSGGFLVILWRTSDWQPVTTLTSVGPHIAAFSPDGQYIAYQGFDRAARIRRLADGEERRIGAGLRNRILSVAFSPDGQYLASAGGEIRFWQALDGQPVGILAGGDQVAFSPNGQYVAGAGGNSVTIWSLESRQRVVGLSTGADGAVFAFAPNGQYVLTGEGYPTNALRLWRIPAGQQLYARDNIDIVTCVAFSPDGQHFASGGTPASWWGSEGNVRLWRASDGQLLRVNNDHPYQVTALAFSPDGQYLASTGYDRTIKIRRISDGQLMQTLYTEYIPSSLAFSPDGQYLLVGVPWDRVEFWRLQDGIPVQIYDTETIGVNSVAFSPSGEFFAYGRHDCTVVVARNPFYSPPQGAGDMNRDGCVNDADLLLVLFNFGSNSASLDMNRDGVVDDHELLLVLLNFGRGC